MVIVVTWVPFEAGLLYTIVAISFVMSILAVTFAYLLSRMTGLFRAWALLIGALVLSAFEDFAYFGSVVFVGYGRVESIVEGYSWGSFLFAGLILVAIPAMFFGSMYKLHSLFKAKVAVAEPEPELAQEREEAQEAQEPEEAEEVALAR
jgi:hypothetical protein